jgi:RNA polymerase sigma-70 factor, ECF subfamily
MPTTNEPSQKELFINSYRENLGEFTRYARSKVGDPEVAKDLVQEAFLKVWVCVREEKEIHNMKSFLYHILKNLIVDRYRKQKSLSLELLLECGSEPYANDSERFFMDMLDGKAAIALIDKLPAKYKDILRMKYEKNLSVGEIAERSGRSPNSVSVCVHRGLTKLRALYVTPDKRESILA